MPKPKNPVQMAIIGAAHGIKGEVRAKAFTGDPLALADYGPLYAEDGREFTIENIRSAGNVVVIRFREVADRNAAEALNGIALYVDRAALPADLDEDEYYHADLVGLLVIDETGDKLGKITALHDFGAGDIIEVSQGGGRTMMVPFTRAAVPEVDIGEGFVRIDSAAAGLGAEEEALPQGAGAGFDPGKRPRGPKSAGGNR